jgi:hypothetical protein
VCECRRKRREQKLCGRGEEDSCGWEVEEKKRVAVAQRRKRE